MVEAAPEELPAFLHPGIGFMMGDGDPEGGASATPPQHLKEYDPEWGQAWANDTANDGVDHATLLAQEKTTVLLTCHFHMTDPDTGQLMGAMTERAISWIMRARRNVRDYERLISHSEAPLTWTMITLMVRRLTRPPKPPRSEPHPVERETAVQPKPIRIRARHQRNTIRLAPTALA
ncbi:hypothetical protein [Streptomyces sp. NPDC020607]|uniref:hypothetical protein n=1 Tax=Streptomyces sp. NPDC020607 TaxID=3365082 RepID=UPI0037B2F0AE